MNGLLKKFIEFAIGNGVVLLLGFISSPIITRIIDPIEYGKFSMFTTITSLLLLIVTLGLDQAYTRFFYLEDESNRGALLRETIKYPLVINIFIGILLMISYKLVSQFIAGENSLLLIVIIIVHNFFSIITRFSFLQIRMKQSAKYYSILNILLKVSYLGFVILFYFKLKNNYLTLVIATVLSNIFVAIFSLMPGWKEWINTKKKSKLKTTRKELMEYGIPLVFSMSVTWVFQYIDKVSIKFFCGYEQNGLYASAMSIIALLNAFQAAFTTFWVPVAYERYNKNPEDKRFFTNINAYISIVMLIMSIGLIGAKDIIVLLLGPKYRESMFIFPFLVFMPIMYTISETTVLGINFKKQTKNHVTIAVVSAVANIVGNILLVPNYGAMGASISTGISYIIFFYMRTYYSLKYYKVDYNFIKFSICIFLVFLLALYSSVSKFNILMLILMLISFTSVIILYKSYIDEVIKKIFKLIKKYKFKN